MKKLILFIPFLALIFSSCIKDVESKYEAASFIEFDANIFNAPVTPYAYTVVTRNVPYGYTSATTYPLISRTSGVIKLRVNVVGKTFSEAQVITYNVITTPAPVSPNALAVEGTHYTTPGTLTIPANSTFGELTLNIVNPGVSSATLREVHLQLVGNSTLPVSKGSSASTVAVRISQS